VLNSPSNGCRYQLKSSGANPIRVAGRAEKDDSSQRVIARDGDKITGEFPLGEIDHWYNEAVPGGEAEQPQSLRGDDRLQLTWALSWPCLLASLVYGLLRGHALIPEEALQSIDLASSGFLFFLFSTWVVRRAVRLDYPGFHLLVTRGAARGVTRTMSYRESLSVTWLICWRTWMILMAAFVVFVAAVAIVTQQRPALDARLLWSIPGWLLNSVAELLIFNMWVVPAALRKNYSGFSLKLDRSGR
jgi:hypothetical protein